MRADLRGVLFDVDGTYGVGSAVAAGLLSEWQAIADRENHRELPAQ